MILITHELIGGALATTLNVNPVAAFFTGWVSHYLFDAVPHWHYRLKPTIKEFLAWDETGMHFVTKLIKTGFGSVGTIMLDGLLGIAAVFFIARPESASVFVLLCCGMAGGVLPDFMVSLSKVFPNRFLDQANALHQAVHTKIFLDEKPLWGIGSQLAAVLIAAFVLYFSTH